MAKYLDTSGLQLYDSNIKNYISGSISGLQEEIGSLNTKVSALNGAIRYIGTINEYTADVTQALLNQQAETYGYTTLEIGLTIVDKNANDWVVTDTESETPWVNIGYYEVSTATNNSLGLVKGGSQITVNNSGELEINSIGSITGDEILLSKNNYNLKLHSSGIDLYTGTNTFSDFKLEYSGITIGSVNSLNINLSNSSGISLNQGNVKCFSVNSGGGVSVGTGSQLTITPSGSEATLKGNINIDSNNLKICPNGGDIFVGSGNKILLSGSTLNPYMMPNDLIGSTLSIGTGSQMTVDTTGYIHCSGISCTGASYSWIDLGSGGITGSGFVLSGSGIEVSGIITSTGGNTTIDVHSGYIAGTGFDIGTSGGYGYIGLCSGGITIWDASNTNKLIELNSTMNSPVLKFGNGSNIITGTMINAECLSGNFGSQISFSSLTQNQINELKQQLGL